MIPATIPNRALNATASFVFEGEGSGLAFAGIYVKDSAATISCDSDNADTKATQFTTNGLSNNCTPDAANDKITITKAGKYYVTWAAVVDLNGGATVDVLLAAYLDGVRQDNLHQNNSVSSVDKRVVSACGFIDVTSVPIDLDLRANIGSATARLLTLSDISLTVIQVSGT
jgi:hypothetical protein